MNVAIDNWKMLPIKESDTGHAYKGISKQKNVLFIKLNTSPLVVVLSQEKLAPRLVWTRRNDNGDILTAQEWLDGRVLEAKEISQKLQISRILYKLHHSLMLNSMLERLGGKVVTPKNLLDEFKKCVSHNLLQNAYLMKMVRLLERNLPKYDVSQYVVVHGDVNHANWLYDQNQELYLVDWDNVCFGDPARDLGYILEHYIPYEKWSNWLFHYGLRPSVELSKRIHWYVIMNILLEIERQSNLKNFQIMSQEINLLKRMEEKL